MFVVTEADAAAIRDIFEREGEFAAAIEVRRRFPGIIDNEKAREQARIIAGWRPIPVPACSVTRPHPAQGQVKGEPSTFNLPESRSCLARSRPIVVGRMGWLRSWLRLTLASFAFPPCRGSGRPSTHQF